MQDYKDKMAVITGGGSGIGRMLAVQLTEAGCHIAICDINDETGRATLDLCRKTAAPGVRMSSHVCDVSDEAAVRDFAAAVLAEHDTPAINLLFNNAGVGGGGSFVKDSREEWDRTFAICWGGVYNCSRAFLPALMAADSACLVNTSSINGFWACLGPETAHTAYSSAKFAVKGFSEALTVDLRLNAPHVSVAVVMPGHIGTGIARNSRDVHGQTEMTQDEGEELRRKLISQGVPAKDFSLDQLQKVQKRLMKEFEERAPTSAAQAATIILDGVRDGRWRILVGEDARRMDQAIRKNPVDAYDPGFFKLDAPGVD